MTVDGSGSHRVFRSDGRIGVVGASLAGLRAAETLRGAGFAAVVPPTVSEVKGAAAQKVICGQSPHALRR